MTLEQLLLESAGTHRTIQLCAENDHEVTLGGNGMNACEAEEASRELFGLIWQHAAATLGLEKAEELRARSFAESEREYADYFGDDEDDD